MDGLGFFIYLSSLGYTRGRGSGDFPVRFLRPWQQGEYGQLQVQLDGHLMDLLRISHSGSCHVLIRPICPLAELLCAMIL
jgi:hypothetical protein